MNNLSDQLLRYLDRAIEERTEKAIQTFIKELIRAHYAEYEIIAFHNLPEGQKHLAKDAVRSMVEKIRERGLDGLDALREDTPFAARYLRALVKEIAQDKMANTAGGGRSLPEGS